MARGVHLMGFHRGDCKPNRLKHNAVTETLEPKDKPWCSQTQALVCKVACG